MNNGKSNDSQTIKYVNLNGMFLGDQ